jgi:fatty-acyl-CoA synthase
MVARTTSYYHRGGIEPLLGHTIPDHFNGVAERFGHQEAVVSSPQGRRLNYTQLARAVDRLALGLLGLGFRPGDRIGIWSTNNIEWILLQMATARMGAILVNINPAYRVQELAYALERTEIQGIFAIPRFHTSDYIAMLAELIPELNVQSSTALTSKAFPVLRRVVVFDPASPVNTTRGLPGITVWPEVLDAGANVPAEDLDKITASLDIDDPVNIQYTSGTTGFPKAVVLSHHNLLNNAVFSAREIEDLIFTHPKVAEVAVVGIPDEYYGEEIMAWIQLHEGETASASEIRNFCQDKIAHFKIPKLIWFVEKFPMTVTGKIKKFRMQEIAVEKLKER